MSTGRRRRTSSCGRAVVEHHHASDHTRELGREPDLLVVAVGREDLRRERVEIGQQERRVGILRVEHVRRERQAALDADDA